MFIRISVLAAMVLVAGCGAIQPVTHAQTDGALCSLYGFAKGQHKDRIFAEIQKRELVPDQHWEDVNAGRLTVGMPVCAIRAAAGRKAIRTHSEYGLTSSYADSSRGRNRVSYTGNDELNRMSGTFTGRRNRMDSLRNTSAVWAQLEKMSRGNFPGTYFRPAYEYTGGGTDF